MWWRSWRRSSSPPDPDPAPSPALTLGTGSLSDAGVPPKASLLDRGLAAGLTVPAGFVVPEDTTVPNVARWCRRNGVHSLAVRSAFGAEDGASASLAGWFDSELWVTPDEFASSVERVRASAERRPGRYRRDVLVMAMVDATQAGVAFCEPGTYDDIVNVTSGLADRLVSGEIGGERIELPRLEPAADGWQRRLQGLLGQVRDVFGDQPWDIEWADDGERVWLVQIRPITAPTIRNEILTAANHAEILPPLPSQLMTSVIQEAGPDLFDWYRQRIPGLPEDRDFLYVKAGRPLINLSLLEDMMRHLGLPTALVAGSIGGGAGRDLPARPLRLLRSTPSLMRLGWAQIEAVVWARRNEQRIAGIGTPPATSFAAVVGDLHRSYVALVTGMFPLSSAIGPPLAALRASGTLFEHAAQHRTVTAEMAERLAELARAAGEDHDELHERFLEDFGHRGVYESDIARPRYRDDTAALATARPAGTSPTDVVAVADGGGRSARAWLTLPVWLLAARPLAARERYRHEAMRSFAAIRDAAVAMAQEAVDDGRLSAVDDLWDLTAPEARRLDEGWRPDADFWSARRAERSELAELSVPHVIGRFDDPAAEVTDEHVDGGVLRGLALTTGRVTGRVVVLDEPDPDAMTHAPGETVVLVARSIDAGWITTLHQAHAVVVEIGGDLSHGSILVRELGMPAVTNVAGATRQLRTGDVVSVDAGRGVVSPDA